MDTPNPKRQRTASSQKQVFVAAERHAARRVFPYFPSGGDGQAPYGLQAWVVQASGDKMFHVCDLPVGASKRTAFVVARPGHQAVLLKDDVVEDLHSLLASDLGMVPVDAIQWGSSLWVPSLHFAPVVG